MQPTETIVVDTPSFGCDGGGGSLGHPRVFLTLDSHGTAKCPYCSRQFQLRAGAKVGGHGH